ncbi:MAG: transporter substrate-binding domain-containing protein [Bacteroidetes bacterium]|nr:transporter substrate-binding domain-containing protein [Bacteroidota bacterium]MCH8524605.1 transporter substrate-binding domain-containing protein [Balneolales bacterium]
MACSGPAEQPPYTGDSWTDVQQRGHGTLTAVYVPAEGFAYFPNSLTYDDTTIPQTEMQENLLTGVTVELLRDFAVFVRQEYGVDLTLNFVEETNWRTFYADVAASKDGVIGMGNVTITEARRSELAFSLPYMTNIASLITHENAPLLEDLSQMGAVWSGRTALAFEATLHEERLRALTDAYYADAAIELVRSNDEIIDRLSEGDRYFAYIDLYNYWRAAERGAPLKRHPAGDESAEEFGYIMPLGTTWQPVLDAWFNADGGLTSTPRYRAIMEEHLGSVLAGILLDQ